MLSQLTAQDAFTEGNIVVLRIGNSTETSDSISNTVWLDEYDVSSTPATLVQSVQVKSGSEELTYGALQTYGGYMSRSSDSLYLTFGGFVEEQPAVAVVDGSVNVDLTTKLDASLGMLRGATSLDGDSLWVSFDGDTRQLYYLQRGTSTVTRAVTTKDIIVNSPKIYNGKLYYTNEYNYNFDLTTFKITGITGKLWYLSDDLPTSETKTYQYSYYSNAAYCTDFIIPNSSVVYIADTSATFGIVKAKAGASSKYGYIGNGDGVYYGLTEYSSDDDSEEIVFYATRKNNSGTYEVIRVTDAGGFTSAPSATVEVVATVSSGAVLRGIALAPKGGVDKLEQTISNFSDLNLTDEDADFELTATTNSGLDLLFSSLDSSVVSIDSNTVHVEAVGATEIIAYNQGNDIYKSVVDTINVIVSESSLPEQEISNIEDFSIVYGETDTLSATAPGGTVSYSSDNTKIIKISGDILTAVGVGSVVITASQDGGGAYRSATKEIVVTVEKADQNFYNFEAITATYNDDDVTISPTVTSGGTITFASNNTAIATVSDEGLVHFSGGGTTYIIASQAGNDYYNALTDSVLVTVNKVEQSISSFVDITKTYGDGNFALQAMASSGLDISYSLGNDTVAQISGSAVKIIGAGSTTIIASQEGNDNYMAADDSVITLTVAKASQSIEDFSDISKTNADDDFDLSASATSGLDVTYSISNESIATISGNTVSIVAAGSTTITASQAGNSNYEEAEDVSVTLIVAGTDLDDITEQAETGVGLYPNPVANGKLTVTFNPAISDARIDIYMLNGIKIYSEDIAAGSDCTTIDTDGFSKGQYILKYYDDSKCFVHPFIK